jgi:hypothetical protein
MITQDVREVREPHAPHTWVCASCGLEHTPGEHDLGLCAWREEQRRLYDLTMEPGSPEWKARRAQNLTEESGKPLRWFYLSFADERFLGAAIVEAPGELHAIEITHRLGINPGGEVAVFAVPEGKPVPDEAKWRLLSRQDLERVFGADTVHAFKDLQ